MSERWLTKRRTSNNWYNRETTPADVVRLLSAQGKSVKLDNWHSTGTSDLKKARLTMARMRLAQNDAWDAIRGAVTNDTIRTAPSAADRSEACRKVFDRLRRSYATKFAEAVRSPEQEALTIAIAGIRRGSLKFKNSAGEGEMLTPIVNEIDRIIDANRWLLPKFLPSGTYADDYRSFYGLVVDAVRDAADVEMRSAKGEVAPKPTSDIILSYVARASNKAGEEDTSLAVVAQKFEQAERRNASKDKYTIDQQSKAIQLFVQHCGTGVPVADITKRQMAAFVEVLLELPIKFSSRSDCKGLSLAAAVSLGAKLKLSTRSPKTVYRELSGVSSFFKWLVQRQYLEHNLTTGLFPHIDKEAGKMPPFSEEHLNLILSSPLFAGCENGLKLHRAGDELIRDWRYWIPLCAMFTGARATELAQLLVSDVRQNGHRWAFHIEPSDDLKAAKTLKNSASRRVVPIHKMLEKAGFLAYVDERRRANDQRLFPGLKPVNGKLGDAPSRSWRGYLTKIGVKHGADGFGLHSFRHTITDQLRLAGYLDDQIAIVLGHSKDLMTTHYGKMAEGTFRQRCEIIDSVAFSEVNFSTILPSDGH